MGNAAKQIFASIFLIVLLPLSSLTEKHRGNSSVQELKAVSLHCEYRTNPLGIDVPRPRLSWVLQSNDSSARGLRQTGYQIQVASSQSLLQAGKADLWDSGKVESARQNQVEYAGKALASRTRCWWKVRVWDQSGRVSPWSMPALWSMGLLHASDWAGHWISGSIAVNYAHAVYLRRVITLRQTPVRATVYICGLGYYRLAINGQRVGQRVLDPAFTNYDKRILYATYDVTHLLRQGPNALGVVLGNGWYHPIIPDLFGFQNAPWREIPRLLINLDVEFPNGIRDTFPSDSSWKWSTGPIIFNDIRGGITYDAERAMPGWDEP